MVDTEFDEFSAMLDDVCTLLSRGRYVPSEKSTAIFWRALAPHPLAVVRAALDAHVNDPERGKFVPVPADLLARIVGAAVDDGRPGSDEAWAIALASADERETVVWSPEMAEAFAACAAVLDAGDEVGARMSFRQTYDRLVVAARRAGREVEWGVSLGSDAERRAPAIAAAARAGRVSDAEHSALSLPAPTLDRLLLAADGVPPEDRAVPAPPEARAALRALRERLAARDAGPSADARARADTAARQAETRANLLTVGEFHALVDEVRETPGLLQAMREKAATQHLESRP